MEKRNETSSCNYYYDDNNNKNNTSNIRDKNFGKNNSDNNDKKNLLTSIVISGWPAVGKTTMASEIAKEFNFKSYNGGDILKMLARDKGYSVSKNDWWDTEEAKRFMAQRKTDPNFDKQVDEKLVEIVKTEKAVITSYTLPWLVEGPVKF